MFKSLVFVRGAVLSCSLFCTPSVSVCQTEQQLRGSEGRQHPGGHGGLLRWSRGSVRDQESSCRPFRHPEEGAGQRLHDGLLHWRKNEAGISTKAGRFHPPALCWNTRIKTVCCTSFTLEEFPKRDDQKTLRLSKTKMLLLLRVSFVIIDGSVNTASLLNTPVGRC